MVSRDTNLSFDEQLAEQISRFYADPLGYVMFMFPWESERSIQMVKLDKRYHNRFDSEYGPDNWACEFLDQLGEEIEKRGFDGMHAVDPIMMETASGHGIGKSVLVSWLIKFISDTRPFSKGVVTASTAEQLRTKTWAELGKWHKMSLTSHWFDYNVGRGAMSLVNKQYPQTWRCDAQTCREENSEAFAGLHAANSTPYYIFDEASGVPDKIFEVREGGTTDGEPMVFDFGNPTRNSGRFFENCVGRFRHRYIFREIDSRTVAITNKSRLQQWVDDYGEESDFVKVRVRGKFPSAGTSQFIATADVEHGMDRESPVVDHKSPLIIGVDVARFGDDESIIYPRIGDDARSFMKKEYRMRGLDTVQLTGKVVEVIRFFKNTLNKSVDALFVDETGIGGAVVDQLRHLGYNPIGVNFGSKPTDDQTYRFKVDEMWGNLRDALKAKRLALPSGTTDLGVDLKNQLTQREFAYTLLGNKINLESKKDMKERLGGEAASPDIADALALTYAQDVALAVDPGLVSQQAQQVQSEYDPYANARGD